MTIKCSHCGEEKDPSLFCTSKREAKGWQQPCKECARKSSASRRLADPLKQRRMKYKATDEELHSFLSGDECEICGVFLTKKYVDHNHTTGKIRGVLCSPCNVGLGHFKDSAVVLEKAIAYLKERGSYHD